MTHDEFVARFKREPQNDDLARINCPIAGTIGHSNCGLCEHGLARFMVCYECHPEWERPEMMKIVVTFTLPNLPSSNSKLESLWKIISSILSIAGIDNYGMERVK